MVELVKAISGIKICCWLMSGSIFLSQAMHRCPISGLAEGGFGLFCSSWMSVVAFRGLVAFGGKELVAFHLFSKADARLLRN